jgi:hypothetical protein
MRRRDFLKAGASLLLPLAGMGKERPDEREARLRNFFLNDYGLSIGRDDRNQFSLNHGISGQELDINIYLRELEFLSQEIIKYPSAFVRDLGITYLRLMNSIVRKDVRRGGLTVYEDDEIYSYLSPPPRLVARNVIYRDHMGRRFHHELYHIAAHHKITPDEEAEWAALNPQGARAYSKNLFPRKPSPDLLSEESEAKFLAVIKQPHHGFVNQEGRLGPEEDQATVAACMLDDFRQALLLAAGDRVLAAKTAFIKNLYTTWSGGRMNEQYWNDLKKRKISRDYWKARSVQAAQSRPEAR